MPSVPADERGDWQVDDSAAPDPDPRATAERDVMLELQRAMLPSGLPVLPDVSLAAEYRPAGAAQFAGGDWFDVVSMPEGAVGLLVGDVVGHGAMAAAVMGQLRAVAAERLLRGTGLDDVLMALDAFAGGSAAARGGTVCVAVLDRRAGSVRYAVRGHPPPLVVAAAGTTRYLAGSTGSPLALLGNRYHVGTETLRPGDTLVLYSDGALRQYGRTIADGLSELAGHAAQVVRHNESGEREIADAICAAVAGAPDAGARPDDVSVVAATVLASPPERLTLSVPAVPGQLSGVRERFASWLYGFRPGSDDLLGLELSVVEAVTNSIEHAFTGTPGTVVVDAALEPDGTVTVEVTDDGRWKPPSVDPGFRGRGMVMMREFSDAMRVTTSEGGTTVVLSRSLHRPVRTDGVPPARVGRPGRPDLRVEVAVGPHGVVVSLTGVVDSSSVDELHARLLDAERHAWLPLAIVLDDVTLLASAGLRTLYDHAGALLARNRTVRLVAADTSPVRDVLAVSGLDRLLEVVPGLG
ncbi:SpoIIE family protein phosphatase [Actinophytocola sp.]|uniref:SpoIIE family protein phosphatase n=1 Tax=Actinophytocola sp. TaxID=1872138 RepID=UPI002D7F0D1C|nr:SpoIIE family protein phosphatase [Actinophytocola sp.]HET9143921.1 SpoIIE family protein phosphatase [Actinophytocola sp.]